MLNSARSDAVPFAAAYRSLLLNLLKKANLRGATRWFTYSKSKLPNAAAGDPIDCDGTREITVDPMSWRSTISSITFRINGDAVTIGSNDALYLKKGDRIELRQVGVKTIARSGVFAAEAFVNKSARCGGIGQVKALPGAITLIDYRDGRFSELKNNFVANGGDGLINGVDGDWVVEDDWFRLTLNLVHDQPNQTVVADRAIIRLDVGVSELASHADQRERCGL